MITYQASSAYLHAVASQVAMKGMAVVCKTPEEVLNFVWAIELPNILPKPHGSDTAASLLSTSESIPRCYYLADLVGTLDTEDPVFVEMPS